MRNNCSENYLQIQQGPLKIFASPAFIF